MLHRLQWLSICRSNLRKRQDIHRKYIIVYYSCDARSYTLSNYIFCFFYCTITHSGNAPYAWITTMVGRKCGKRKKRPQSSERVYRNRYSVLRPYRPSTFYNYDQNKNSTTLRFETANSELIGPMLTKLGYSF